MSGFTGKKIIFTLIACVLAFVSVGKITYASEASVKAALDSIDFERKSKNEINLFFSGSGINEVGRYVILRKDASAKDFKEIKRISSKDVSKTGNISYTDKISTNGYVKYEYRVDAYLKNGKQVKGKSIFASNVLICIDPGHFQTKNAIEGEDGYGYSESMAVLKLGLALRDSLKKNYGISSVLTRTTESITIDGFTDKNLDGGHISLRGDMAGRSSADLFISLHTNSNNSHANGYPTNSQPVTINKPLIILNSLAKENEICINIANKIGENLSVVNFNEGLAKSKEFDSVKKGSLSEWTVAKNDSITINGSVYYRMGENGDYYGVLRGANVAGVPGMIVEHGFHSVPEVRKKAMQSDLINKWGEADAKAIAAGFGF